MAASDPFLKKLNESEHQQHHETGAKNNKNMMLMGYMGSTLTWEKTQQNESNEITTTT